MCKRYEVGDQDTAEICMTSTRSERGARGGHRSPHSSDVKTGGHYQIDVTTEQTRLLMRTPIAALQN